MGISGQPIEKLHDKIEIIETITANGGNIVRIAHALKINPQTVYNYCTKHPELWDLINNSRRIKNGYEKKLRIDLGLNDMDNTLYSKDAKRSDKIKVAMYYLDNLGEEEGFGRIQKENDKLQASVTPEFMQKHDGLINDISKFHSARNMEDKSIINET